MRKHQLTVDQVGAMLNRTPTTVRIWCCETEASKTIPEHSLELLQLKAGELQPA